MQSKGFTLLKVAPAGFLAGFRMVLLPGAALAAPDPVILTGGTIEYLQALILWLAGTVLVIAGFLLLISLLRFQRRPADTSAAEQGQPGNGPLEMIWTLIPVAILVALIIMTYQSLTGA